MKDWELECLFRAETLARRGYIDPLMIKDVTLKMIRQHESYDSSMDEFTNIERILPPGQDDPPKDK